MRSVVLSTLPHLLAIWALFPLEGLDLQLYAVLIGASTTASVAWHLRGEPYGPLFWLDYSLAGAWTLADIVLAHERGGVSLLTTVAYLNFVTILANKVTDWMAEKGWVSYEVGHTAWHCMSWSKCWLVAWLLRGSG